MDNIAITVCATSKYAYAVISQARSVLANISYLGKKTKGTIVLVSDNCEKMKSLELFYQRLLPKRWKVEHLIISNESDSHKNYGASAQLLIAKMRGLSATFCKKLDVDYYWSLDSDVIPKPNSLKCMIDVINFDNDLYQVAACPYPSQGGGPFMLGHGTPRKQICPNFYPEEKLVPEKVSERIASLKNKLESLEKAFEKKRKVKKEKDESFEERRILFNKIRRWELFVDKKCPPAGNVYELNSKFGWKKRGWLDYAYPSIGRGAVIPSDWCGFGNTLCSKKALDLIDFSGYEGKGTEDLFIIWNCWYPNNVRIGGLPHCPADHIIRRDGGFVHLFTYHEPDGEFEGHLRQQDRKWLGDEDTGIYPNTDSDRES